MAKKATNTFKKDTKTSSKKKKASKSKAKSMDGLKNFVAFFKDERLHKSLGLLLILFGIYTIVACVSYLFTWKFDASIIDGKSLGFVFDGEESEIRNWLGKLGAITAHQFLKVWFGVASLFIPFYAIIIGVRVVFKIKLLPLFKTVKIGFVGMVWLSIAMAFIFDAPRDFMGGLFGEQIISWVDSALGFVGALFFSG